MNARKDIAMALLIFVVLSLAGFGLAWILMPAGWGLTPHPTEIAVASVFAVLMGLANFAALVVAPRGSFGMLMIGCVLILPTLLVDIAVFGLVAEGRVIPIVEGACILAGGIAYACVTIIYARRGLAMAWGRYGLLPRNSNPSWFRQAVVMNLCASVGLIVFGFLRLFSR